MKGRHTRVFVDYDEDAKVGQAFPPTGKTFASTQTHWLRIADGQVIEHWANRDDLGTALQLGWVPPTPLYLARALFAKRKASVSLPPLHKSGGRRRLRSRSRREPARLSGFVVSERPPSGSKSLIWRGSSTTSTSRPCSAWLAGVQARDDVGRAAAGDVFHAGVGGELVELLGVDLLTALVSK